MATLFILIVSFIFVLDSQAADFQRYGLFLGCDESGTEFSVTCDDKTVGYYDYRQQRFILTLPDFIGPVEVPDLHKDALQQQSICNQVLTVLKEVYENQTEQLEPPWSSIYPNSEVKLKETNTLVCHISAFFPPPVTVTWTRNGVDVSDESRLGPYYGNADGTLAVFSVLSFTPEEGDSYSCTVQHPALDIPQTRIWDVEVDVTVEKLRLVTSLVCGVGLIVGLMGIAVGVFFFIKANNQ